MEQTFAEYLVEQVNRDDQTFLSRANDLIHGELARFSGDPREISSHRLRLAEEYREKMPDTELARDVLQLLLDGQAPV